ncbi:MAG: ribosomal L7Ae/L30e/S12e/Gadd45 family protein [Candidatus Aenigmarchaeota archaeon]|nr:ribosomal L7Ae/L30e/S12e/Gadd45 family protein [Candidatus Aenigmarchaeota archaeon]
METVNRIPAGNAVIGAKEVVKSIKSGKVKRVIVANNCPQHLIERIESAGKVVVEVFEGNQKEFSIRLGKPFLIAAAGFEK